MPPCTGSTNSSPESRATRRRGRCGRRCRWRDRHVDSAGAESDHGDVCSRSTIGGHSHGRSLGRRSGHGPDAVPKLHIDRCRTMISARSPARAWRDANDHRQYLRHDPDVSHRGCRSDRTTSSASEPHAPRSARRKRTTQRPRRRSMTTTTNAPITSAGTDTAGFDNGSSAPDSPRSTSPGAAGVTRCSSRPTPVHGIAVI